jgi:hypothetical protein
MKDIKLNDKYIRTFTKKWVNRLLWFGVIWITWSYILASFGKETIAEALSQTVAEVIIATVLGYLCKAFFETYSQKKNELKEKEMKLNTSETENEDDDN